MKPSDTIFNYVSKPPLYRGTREFNVFGDWWRVNVYQEREVAEGVWGKRMAASYMVRCVDNQYLDFHYTTPA